MRLTLALIITAITFASFANCSPIESDSPGELVRADRHRRLTCDLLSIQLPKFSVNHSACAAHCLAMRRGYKGGTCKNGVCHCRK